MMDTSNMIFVFGSNEAGVHGAGAARFALDKKGAIMGQAFGMQGNSFAIPTKDKTIRNTLSLDEIKVYVNRFIDFARTQTDRRHAPLIYQVTCIGCGLAGLKHEDIAPMFRMATKNVLFDDLWKPWLEDYSFSFWGTF